MLYRGGRGIRWNVGLLYYLVLKVNTFSCLLDCTSYLIDTDMTVAPTLTYTAFEAHSSQT